MRYVLFILLFPGSLTLAALIGSWALRKFNGWREDDADLERAARIAREYDVPEWVVLPEPTGRPARRLDPSAPTSRYREVVDRG